MNTEPSQADRETATPENFRPILDKLLVHQVAPSTKFPGGRLHRADAYKDWPPIGVVVSVGPGKIGPDGERIPVSVKPGDQVMFKRRSRTEVEQFHPTDEDRYLILCDDDLIGIVEEE